MFDQASSLKAQKAKENGGKKTIKYKKSSKNKLQFKQLNIQHSAPV